MSFACHRKQDVPVLVCINCCSVFHPSCFKRDCKYVNKQQVDSYKVICCEADSEAEKTNLTVIRNKQREENNCLRETNDSLKCELENVNLENENLKGELDQLKEINRDLSKSSGILQELVERTVDEEYNELLNENRSLKEQKSNLKQEIVDLTTQLSKSGKHLEKYRAQLAEMEESLTKALLVSEEDNLKLLQQSEAMNVLKNRVDEERERNLQLSDDVNKQDVYLRTLKVKHEEEKQDLICRVDSMQDIIDETKQENNEIQRLFNQKLTESLRRNVELMKEIGNLKETLDSSDRNSSSENSNKIKDVSRLQTELTEANARITNVQDEVVNLQEQNNKLISENKEVDRINKEMLTTIEVLTIESSLYKSELDKITAQVDTSNESIETTSQCTIGKEEMTSRHEQLGENIEEKLYRRIYYRLKMDLLEELSQQRPISGTNNDNKEQFLGDTARNSRMKPDLENTKDTRTQKTYLQAAAGSKEMTKRDKMRQKTIVDNQQQMLNDMKKVQNSSKDERGRSNFHHGNTPKQRQESVGQKTKDNTGNENDTITINVNKKEIRKNRLEPSNQLNNSKRGEFKSPKESSSRIRDQNDINVSTLKQNKKTSSIYGSMTESSRLKAYMPLSHIHISKVRLENDAQDIIEYVKNKIPNTDVECEEVKVKSGMYKSFKLSLPANCSSKLLQSSFWPESVAVRKFRNFEKNFQMKQNAVQKT